MLFKIDIFAKLLSALRTIIFVEYNKSRWLTYSLYERIILQSVAFWKWWYYSNNK